MTDEPPTPTFAELGIDDRLLRVLKDVGYESPSPIQAETIPLLLEGKDVVGLAQTGTGKTAAFALPILGRIDPSRKDTQALVLALTRELALQVAEAFASYAAYVPGLNILPIYGGQHPSELAHGVASSEPVAECQIEDNSPLYVASRYQENTIGCGTFPAGCDCATGSSAECSGFFSIVELTSFSVVDITAPFPPNNPSDASGAFRSTLPSDDHPSCCHRLCGCLSERRDHIEVGDIGLREVHFLSEVARS